MVIQVISKDDPNWNVWEVPEKRISVFLNGGQQLEVVRFGVKVRKKHLTEMPGEHFSS